MNIILMNSITNNKNMSTNKRQRNETGQFTKIDKKKKMMISKEII
jgi:hypothetical protein